MADEPKVSPSIHPAVIERHYARDGRGQHVADAVLDKLRDAMAVGRETAEDVLGRTKAIRANALQTREANDLQARTTGFKLLERATRRFDDARAAAVAEIDRIEKATAAPRPPTNVADALMAGEIRAALARMTDEQRRIATAEAISSGDDVTVGALLHGPAILSGMSPATRELFRYSWRKSRFPAELERLERLRLALDDLERAGAILVSFVDKLTDAKRIAKAEESAAVAARAAVA